MNISRLNFAHLPTPIEPLPRLSEALGGPRLLIKRDDQTGLAFGGNKTRKLEFLVAEARDQGAQTLISGGALQSNHCRQTAAAAARFGFKQRSRQNPSGDIRSCCERWNETLSRSVWWVESHGRVGICLRNQRAHGAKPPGGLDRVCHILGWYTRGTPVGSACVWM